MLGVDNVDVAVDEVIFCQAIDSIGLCLCYFVVVNVFYYAIFGHGGNDIGISVLRE